MVKKLNAKTILMKRDSVKHITSNMADENVFNYDYDIVIENNGTLEELKEKAKLFVNDLKNNDLKERY
jgi:dephospho-CoA kinase